MNEHIYIYIYIYIYVHKQECFSYLSTVLLLILTINLCKNSQPIPMPHPECYILSWNSSAKLMSTLLWTQGFALLWRHSTAWATPPAQSFTLKSSLTQCLRTWTTCGQSFCQHVAWITCSLNPSRVLISTCGLISSLYCLHFCQHSGLPNSHQNCPVSSVYIILGFR
jgi:hypothetical protein